MKRLLLILTLLICSVAEARPIRYVSRLTPSNYKLYQDNAIGNGQVAWKANYEIPPNIATNYGGWRRWKEYRVAQFEKLAPLERSNTYYFSSAGLDANACTTASPCLTRSKCASLITTNGGNTRCRFKFGETFDDATDLVITSNGNTLDCWGTAAECASKPLFNAFTNKYNSSGWTLATGNRYTRAETNDIAWIRNQADRLGVNLVRTTSSANCEALSNSFFWGANVLHINLGGTNPNTLNLEAVTSNTANGVESQGDGNRVEGLRADGYGMDRSNSATQAQPFTNRSTGNKANYFKNLEGYYSGTHIMAHNAPSGAGGKSVWNGCKAGFPMYGASGDNLFNTYSRDGEQETWFLNSTLQYGTLKSSDWSYTTLFQRGGGFFGHTQSTLFDIGLFVVDTATLVNSHSPLSDFGTANKYADPTDIKDFSQYRLFFSNITQEATGNAVTGVNLQWGENEILYALRFKAKLNTGGIGAYTNYVPTNTWVINSDFELNQATVASNYSALYNTTSTDNRINFLNTSIRAINAAVNGVVAFGVDYDEGFATTNVAGTGSSRNSTMRNSILSIVNSGTSTRTRLNLTNSATALFNNRFFDVDQNAGFEGGYDLGTSQSTLSSAYDLTSQAPLLGAGNTDIVVSHDINGKQRDSFPPDIGPVDF